MTFDVFLAFVAFCFVSSATPGPNNLMLMASGANFGVRRTIPHWLGIGVGFTAMVIVVGLGLMQVFEMFPIIYQGMKILSAAFLLYLAWKIANAAPMRETGKAGNPMTFLQAAAFQWVNPKAWAMALTAISIYSPSNSVLAVVITALIFGLVNLPSCSIWMFVGRQLHRFLTNPVRMRVFNITMSLLLLTSLYPLLIS